MAQEVTLADVVATLWSRRLLVIGMTIGFGAVVLAVALTMTPLFQSSVLISPVSQEEEGSRFSGASALLSQFGGLSAIGGLNFSALNRKAEAVAVLQSRALTETYIMEKNLLPVLFEDQWDKDAKRWKNDDPKKQPTLWKGEEFFRTSVREVVEDKKTGLVKLTITWKDPVVATAWANDLVRRVNLFLRQKSIDQSNRNIGYLDEQLGRTSVVELQKAIYGLIESEIKKTMIAQGSEEYAFKVIDPAAVPERKARPKRLLMAIGGAAFGFVLASAFVLSQGVRRRAPA